MGRFLQFIRKYLSKDQSSEDSSPEYGDFFERRFPKLDEWDKKSLVQIYNRHSDPRMRKLARTISFLGDPRLWIIALIAFLLVGINDNNYSLFIVFLTGFLQSYLFYYIVKNRIKRARPFIALNEDGIVRLDKSGHGFSFPSGHSHHSAVLFGLLILSFLPYWWMLPVLLLYNIVVPYSRLVSGCHYPSDTIFGILEAYIALTVHWFFTKEIYLSIYYLLSGMHVI